METINNDIVYAVMRQEQSPCEMLMSIDCVWKNKEDAIACLGSKFFDTTRACDEGLEEEYFKEYRTEESEMEWYIFSTIDETHFIHLWIEPTMLMEKRTSGGSVNP